VAGRLVRIYDVDAEAQLAKKLKELTMKTSFNALRIELQRIVKRLNKFDGWELGEEALVVWAGLAMRQDHWTTLQRENPKNAGRDAAADVLTPTGTTSLSGEHHR
jgi:hypothetical protein